MIQRQQPISTHPSSGFTLIEMAIVLVIIGLLVGGVLQGQTFLNNAKLNAMMTESKGYINAFNQFIATKHAVPGDYSSINTGVATQHYGDGNGVIRAGATPNTGELFGAFEHLAKAGLIPGSYTGVTGSGGTAVAVPGVNIPQSTALSNATYLFNHPDALDGNVSGDTTYFNGKYGHVLTVAGNTAGGLPSTGIVTPVQALAIDDKYDDGAPGTGWITVKKPAAANTTDCANDVTTTAAYNTALTTKVCYFFLNITGS